MVKSGKQKNDTQRAKRYLNLGLLERNINGVFDFIGALGSKDKEVFFYEEFQKKSDPHGMESSPSIIKEGHRVKERILDSIFKEQDVKTKSVLDVGCGENTLPELNKAEELVLQDISLNALLRNKQKHKDRKNRIYARSKDLRIFNGNSADLIFAGEIIEHLSNPSVFIKECYRILKPGRTLILTTPNKKALLYKMTLRNFGKDEQHISLMTYKEIKKLVEKYFVIRKKFGINQSCFPVFQQLNHNIKNKGFVKWWASVFKNKPRYATGIIFVCKKIPAVSK